jgi:hypothetical protein
MTKVMTGVRGLTYHAQKPAPRALGFGMPVRLQALEAADQSLMYVKENPKKYILSLVAVSSHSFLFVLHMAVFFTWPTPWLKRKERR